MRPPGRRDGPPDWFDHSETELECDHDIGATRVENEPPYARYECNHSDCDEGYCKVRNTDGN